jgi:hypothetical protein
MNERKGSIVKLVMIAVLATGLSPADARAAEAGEVQDLRRELGQLRAETQALQTALAEMAELDRQQAANLARALNGDAAPAKATPPPAAPAPSDAAATETRPPATQSAPSSGGTSKRRSKAKHRRHRR